MKIWNKVPFSDLLLESRDGEWGDGEPKIGYQLCEMIRGTDFADLNDQATKLPLRWIPDHLVERKRLQIGDIIFEMAGGTAKQSTGRSAVLSRSFFEMHSEKPVLCASFCRHLRLDQDRFEPGFIYYLLQTLYKAGYMSVYNIQHTGVSRFQYTAFKKKTVLDVPELPIQKKIAAILSAYDDLIENNQRRIALLEKMAEELYREWFVRLRFPGHEHVKIEKGVPEGWKVSSLGEIAQFTMGQSPSSEFYNESGIGFPFNQGVGTYGDRFPRKVTYCSSEGRFAKEGDILFSVRAPVGRLNIADCEMVIGRGLAAIRHKEGKNSYLFYFMKVAFANEDIIGNGSIFNSVGKDELARFPVFIPERQLIERFDSMAKTVDGQISTLIQANERFEKSKNMLLPRLISGKLSVADLDIAFPPSMQDAAS